MATTLVLVPVARELVGRADVFDPDAEMFAIAANEQLHQTFELGPDEGEQAEYAALSLASLWGALHLGNHVVLSLQANPAQLRPASTEVGNGAVLVQGPSRKHAVAWFDCDVPLDPDTAAGLADADLDQAWDDERVQRWFANREFIWHDIEEWS